ncbi:MAG: outer membrane beta-barrel protein [Chlorobiaceae bacterium]
MKKHLFLFFTAVFMSTMLTVPVYANNYYVSGSVGLGLTENALWRGNIEDKLNNSVVVNGAIGCNINPGRLELGVGYQSHKYSDFHPQWGDMSFLTVMGNGYYDFNADGSVSPYVMAGAGLVDVHTGNDFMNQTAFAWQVGAGICVKVTDGVTVDLGYRYLKPEGLHSVMNDSLVWTGHDIVAGVRYDF